jgi:hypothetical protein
MDILHVEVVLHTCGRFGLPRRKQTTQRRIQLTAPSSFPTFRRHPAAAAMDHSILQRQPAMSVEPAQDQRGSFLESGPLQEVGTGVLAHQALGVEVESPLELHAGLGLPAAHTAVAGGSKA